MGRDNQAKNLQLRRKENKAAQRARKTRILIVTEGSKTEPQYLCEIQTEHRPNSTIVKVQPGRLGTESIQVVRYAQQLFEKGDLHRRISPKSFDEVYAVFDRDGHTTFFEALDLAKSLDRKLRNDEKQLISFEAIASVPCFELWLLLHYEPIQAPINRKDVLRSLKHHLPNYEKGGHGTFAMTRDRLEQATQRAEALATKFSARTDPEPYTEIHKLVELLTKLRN